LAFAAGLVAALNPCGFAMLPAYLILVVRGEGTDPHGTRPDTSTGLTSVGRALAATVGMGLGFLTVFGVFGALTISAASTVQRYLPYVTVVIGITLVGLGIWLLSGRELTLLTPKSLSGRWAPTVRLGSMYGYGVSYAIASLSCTVGPFLAVTAAGIRGGSVVGSISIYLGYVAGLTLVVGVLAIAAASASSALADRMKRILPFVNRISGALLVAVGLYVGYYGLYEVRLFGNAHTNPQDAVIAAAGRVQGVLAGWVHQHGAWPWVLAFAVLMAGALAALVVSTGAAWLSWLPEPAAPAAPQVAHEEQQGERREADHVEVLDVADVIAVQHHQQQEDDEQAHEVPVAVVDFAPAPVRGRHISDVDPTGALHLGTGHGNSSGRDWDASIF
jgi:cytochrome c biogenesis protein CcdA